MNYSTKTIQPGSEVVRTCATFLFVLLFVVPITTGCGDKIEKEDERNPASFGDPAAGDRARYGNLTRDGFGVESTDLNQDDQPDQWTLSGGGKVERIERDLNFDGQVDLWQYPNASGEIAEEEMDLDLDGRVDVVVYYEGGVVNRKELSTDFDGQFSIIKFYDKKGELLRVERDEDGDRDIDVWEYYENKQRVRIGWDENNDGQPDRFDSLE